MGNKQTGIATIMAHSCINSSKGNY